MKTIFSLIKKEIERQKEELNLIASENYVSEAVLRAEASPLINKYSEGYPKNRYYPGCKYYDEIEILGQKLAKKLFKLTEEWSVNLQPYSGAIANLAVYFAFLNPGEKILAMDLSAGGHLSHGSKAHISSKIFNFIYYGVDEKTGLINYKEVEKIAKKENPKMIVCGASSYPRKIDFKKFYKIAKSVNAIAFADISHIAGLIAAGVHLSPFPFFDVVTTTTQKTLRGPRGAIIFSKKKFENQINKVLFPGLQGGPHNHSIAAKVVCLKESLSLKFKRYAKQIIKNANVLANELKKYNFKLMTGGTDNHLILIDLKNKYISGIEAEKYLEETSIIANRNVLPGDKKAFNPSGLRIGLPAVTTLGMKEKEMKKIAYFINEVLNNPSKRFKIKKEVNKFVRKFTKNLNKFKIE